MSDWEHFTEAVPWFLSSNTRVRIGEPAPWSRSQVDGLPRLNQLLNSATVTPVDVNGRSHELFAWGPTGSRRGWIGPAAIAVPPQFLHPAHASVLRALGGVTESFNEPASWWTNQDEVLTISAAEISVAKVFTDYAWLWDDAGLALPIDPQDFYAVAVEANGNLTLVHRDLGELVLLAPDHAFDGVTVMEGSPPYSLMTIDEAPDLPRWIELCAEAWLAD